MSGIVAIMSLDGRPIPPELPRAQLAAIAHRGEWEPRLWEAPGIALGHVNLPRTPEAEREFLPAPDSTGRYWLTWDGRLDNRDDLAGKLNYDAAQRTEKTDADYVLDAFVTWGDDCVHHLLGDWAVVIWDNQARRLFCAKDPIGWRQLYYAEHDGLLAVGSEPQQFFANGWLPRVPNEEYVLKFLAGAVQENGATCHLGIKELVGGQRVSAGTTPAPSAGFFWTPGRIRKAPFKHPSEYVDEFRARFEIAVAARLRSNSRIGAFLSGGLDSSYACAAAAAAGHLPLGIHGYVPGAELMDERKYARLVADHLNMPLLEVDISDCWTFSSGWLPDEAFDDVHHAAQFASHLKLAQAARAEGIGVLLGGDGADDWLSGIGYVGDALLSGHIRTSWRLARPLMGRRRPVAGYLRAAYRDLAPVRARDWLSARRGQTALAGLAPIVSLQADWRPKRALVDSPSRPRGSFALAAFEHHRDVSRRSASWRERHAFAPSHIDQRAPFLDLRVVELLAATPNWVKRFNGRKKDILRAAEAPLLPPAIPNRDDNGVFDPLLEAGVFSHETQRIQSAVKSLCDFPGVNPTALCAEVHGWLAGTHEWGGVSIRAISTGLWYRQLTVSRQQVVTHSPTRGGEST